MAQYHLRTLHHRLVPPMVLGASFGTAAVEKINTALLILFSFLLFRICLRFFNLLCGERKLEITNNIHKYPESKKGQFIKII